MGAAEQQRREARDYIAAALSRGTRCGVCCELYPQWHAVSGTATMGDAPQPVVFAVCEHCGHVLTFVVELLLARMERESRKA